MSDVDPNWTHNFYHSHNYNDSAFRLSRVSPIITYLREKRRSSDAPRNDLESDLFSTARSALKRGPVHLVRLCRWMITPRSTQSRLFQLDPVILARYVEKDDTKIIHPLAAGGDEKHHFQHLKSEYDALCLSFKSCENARYRMAIEYISAMRECRTDSGMIIRRVSVVSILTRVLTEIIFNNTAWYSLLPLSFVLFVHRIRDNSNPTSRVIHVRCVIDILSTLSRISRVRKSDPQWKYAAADRSRRMIAILFYVINPSILRRVPLRIIHEAVSSTVSTVETINLISPRFGQDYHAISMRNPRWVVTEPTVSAYVRRFNHDGMYIAWGRKVILESSLAEACGREPNRMCLPVRIWMSTFTRSAKRALKHAIRVPWTIVSNIISFLTGWIANMNWNQALKRDMMISIQRFSFRVNGITQYQINEWDTFLGKVPDHVSRVVQVWYQLYTSGRIHNFPSEPKQGHRFGNLWPRSMKRIFQMDPARVSRIHSACMIHFAVEFAKGIIHARLVLSAQRFVWKYLGYNYTDRKVTK